MLSNRRIWLIRFLLDSAAKTASVCARTSPFSVMGTGLMYAMKSRKRIASSRQGDRFRSDSHFWTAGGKISDFGVHRFHQKREQQFTMNPSQSCFLTLGWQVAQSEQRLGALEFSLNRPTKTIQPHHLPSVQFDIGQGSESHHVFRCCQSLWLDFAAVFFRNGQEPSFRFPRLFLRDSQCADSSRDRCSLMKDLSSKL